MGVDKQLQAGRSGKWYKRSRLPELGAAFLSVDSKAAISTFIGKLIKSGM